MGKIRIRKGERGAVEKDRTNGETVEQREGFEGSGDPRSVVSKSE